MRLALLPVVFAVTLVGQVVGDDGPVGIGVWYPGPAARPPATTTSDVETLRGDLASIRRAGFNAITTWTSWREAEVPTARATPQRARSATNARTPAIAGVPRSDSSR